MLHAVFLNRRVPIIFTAFQLISNLKLIKLRGPAKWPLISLACADHWPRSSAHDPGMAKKFKKKPDISYWTNKIRESTQLNFRHIFVFCVFYLSADIFNPTFSAIFSTPVDLSKYVGVSW